MQKDWIPQEMPRALALPPGGRWRSGLGALSSSSSGFLLRQRDWGASSRSLGSFRLRPAVRGSVTTSTTG
jgi:hypothetical protein